MPNLFRAAGMVVWSARSAFACSLRGRIWLPFLAIAALQLLTLGGLLNFHHAALAPLFMPIITGLAGSPATHYPNFYLALPLIFSRVTMALSVVLVCVMVGAAILLFAQAFGRAGHLPAWKTAWKRYPSLLLATLLLSACLFGIPYLSRLVPSDLLLGNGMVRWTVRGGLLFLSVLVQTLLIYAAAWILLRNQRLVPAISKSMGLARSTFLTTFVVVAVPALILFPTGFLTSRSDLFLNKFSPETMVAIVMLQIALEILLGFLLVGATTRIFIYQTEEAA